MGIFYSCSTAFGNGPGVGFALKDPLYAWFNRAYAGFEVEVSPLVWKTQGGVVLGLDEHAKVLIARLNEGKTLEEAVNAANAAYRPMIAGVNPSAFPRGGPPSSAFVDMRWKGDANARIVNFYVNPAQQESFSGVPTWYWVRQL
jgi:hypothetical protein